MKCDGLKKSTDDTSQPMEQRRIQQFFGREVAG
jgi:hypothetical protein